MRSSIYSGAGPERSALPASVILVEEIRQALIAVGMHPDVEIFDKPFRNVIDTCVRNGVRLDVSITRKEG